MASPCIIPATSFRRGLGRPPWDANERAFERVGRELVEMFPDRIAAKCRDKFRRSLPDFLCKLCLDPGSDLRTQGVAGFNGLEDALRQYKARFEKAAFGMIAATPASRAIYELLDYALSQRGIVLVEGTYRLGKSMAAQAWAQTHLGECRYVQLTSSGDEGSFYRCFARSLGVACSSQMKAAEMRNRVEEVMRRQHLLILLDESDYVFEGTVKVRQAPTRVNWLMTAVINAGVPLAMIASRNFARMMRHVETRCPTWGSEQFTGRIKLRRALPDDLEERDLFAIAEKLVPEADESTRMLLVAHAMRSDGYVAALEAGAFRARFFATRAGRQVEFEDVERVMVESGTDKPVSPPSAATSSTSPTRRAPVAKGSRAAREATANHRQPLGALAGPLDFTGSRPPGLLP